MCSKFLPTYCLLIKEESSNFNPLGQEFKTSIARGSGDTGCLQTWCPENQIRVLHGGDASDEPKVRSPTK